MKEVSDMMMFVNAFAVCGLISLAGQLIYDNTKLTAGHITSMFVVIGAALDTFGLYDKLIEFAGAGASLPITSFGHSLIHGALAQAQENGLIGIIAGMFDMTASGITAAILFAFLAAVVFKPKS
jgi:stage V sporulation protein AE